MAKQKFKVGTKVVYKETFGNKFSEVQYVISYKTMNKLETSGKWTEKRWHNESMRIYGCKAIFIADQKRPTKWENVGWMPEDSVYEYNTAMKVLYGKT